MIAFHRTETGGRRACRLLAVGATADMRRLLAETDGEFALDIDVLHADTPAQALARIARTETGIDAIVVDLEIFDGAGDAADIATLFSTAGWPVLAIGAQRHSEHAVRAMRAGACDYLYIDRIDARDLARALDLASSRHALRPRLHDCTIERDVLFDRNPQPVLAYHTETLALGRWNAAACRTFGYSDLQFGLMRIIDLLDPEEHARFAELTRNGDIDALSTHPWTLRSVGGERVALRLHAHSATADASTCWLIGEDVGDLLRAREAAAQAEARYRQLLDQSGEFVCEHDIQGRLISVNRAAARALGYPVEVLEGRMLHEVVPLQFRGDVDIYLAQIESQGQYSGILTLLHQQGHWLVWRFASQRHADVELGHYIVGQARDVTEQLRRERELREQIFTDALTGARNRRYLEHLEHAGQLGDWGCVLVDLDDLKQINEASGRRRGDELLRGIADFLRSHVRENDVVARLGSDEFLIVLRDGEAAFAHALAERLRAALGYAPCPYSLGIAIKAIEDETLMQTMARAETQLLAARGVMAAEA